MFKDVLDSVFHNRSHYLIRFLYHILGACGAELCYRCTHFKFHLCYVYLHRILVDYQLIYNVYVDWDVNLCCFHGDQGRYHFNS